MTPLFETATILIIDDTPSNLSVVVSMCEEKGYRVAIAQDGEEGLQRAKLVHPDLILLDVMMPGMDGFEACKQLKALPCTRDTPVIFMTALASTEHKVKGFQAGAVDYVTKPLQIDEVMARLETHLQLHAAQKRLAEHNEALEQRVAARTAELVAREREFRTLAENLPDNLARYDKQCRILYLNPSLETLLGAKTEAVRGKLPTESAVGKFYIDYQACMEQTIATGLASEIELQLPDSGEGIRIHHLRFVAERDVQGEIVGALAIGRDITERKRAESELHLLNLAMNSSSEAAFLSDEQGHFVYVNEEACRSLGYSRDELLGQTPLDIDPDITAAVFAGLMESIFLQGASKRPMESRHRTRDGHIFPVEIAASPLELEGKKYCLTMVRDISERKHADAKLHEREQALSAVVENSPDTIVRYDRELRRIYLNPAMEEIFGLPREQLLNTSPIVSTPLPDQYQLALRKVIESGKEQSMEAAFKDATGRARWVDLRMAPEFGADGAVATVLAIGRDITERKQAERELLLLNHALDSSFDATYLVGEDMKFRYVNDAAVRELGYSREELLTMTILDVDPNLSREVIHGMMQQTAAGSFQGTVESAHRRKNGETFPVEIGATVIYHNGEKLFLSVVRNITERKKSEEALRQSDQRYRLVFENSPISIWEEDFSAVRKYFDALRDSGVTDIDAYFAQYPEAIKKCADLAKIVDVNQAAVDLHDAQSKEALFAGLFNTFTPESFEAFRQELSGLWQGRMRMSLDAAVKTRSGALRRVTVHFSVCPGFEESFEKVLVSIVDITERKLAEEALAVREREFRTLAENIPDNIIRYDAQARKIYVNTATTRLMGVKPEVLLNQMPEETPEDVRTLKIDEYARCLQRVLESGEPQEMEVTLRHAEQGMQVHNVRFVAERDEQGNIVGALMVGRDITVMKTIESELMEREQRYREIFENAVESMYLLEATDDGRFRNIDINPALAASTGMPREALIGQFVDDTVPEDMGKQIVEKYRRCVAAGSTITESLELDLPVGKRHYISTITPIRYQGRIHRLIGISRDITELKKVERELEESRAQLRGLTARREAVREEERKYIAREVHDELGQILTGLKMKVSLLEHRFAVESPELSDFLKETAQLTDRSLAVARNVASALRPASLDMGIASALEWLADRFSGNTGIECSTHVDDGEFELAESSAIALFRIAQESLTNVARHAQATHIEIDLCRGQDDYVLKVRDNGVGFDLSQRKIDSYGVVGMRERALMLGGELVVESQPGKGTQVMVRIPRKEIEGEI